MKHKIVFALIMGFITTCIISFSLVTVNAGFGPHFIKIWLRSWLIAYIIVIPVLLFLAPKVQRFVNEIFDKKI
jgi:hypothetical protein